MLYSIFQLVLMITVSDPFFVFRITWFGIRNITVDKNYFPFYIYTFIIIIVKFRCSYSIACKYNLSSNLLRFQNSCRDNNLQDTCIFLLLLNHQVV